MSRVGDRDGEAGLPHAAGARKGHKSCKVECSDHAHEIALPADEGCGFGEVGDNRLLISGKIRNLDALRLDRPHELVSVSYDGRDVRRLGKGIIQRPTETADVDLQIALIDDDVRPRPLDQGILADLLSGPHHQQVQNVHRPATQPHGSAIPQEDVLARNEPEWAEHKGNVNRFI